MHLVVQDEGKRNLPTLHLSTGLLYSRRVVEVGDDHMPSDRNRVVAASPHSHHGDRRFQRIVGKRLSIEARGVHQVVSDPIERNKPLGQAVSSRLPVAQSKPVHFPRAIVSKERMGK